MSPALPAALTALVFLGLAGLHASWALGGVWPGTDRDSLHRLVVGGPPGMRGPGRGATWVVAAALLGAALTVLSGAGLVELPLPGAWVRGAGLAGAGVLAVRGLEGFLDTRLRPSTVGSPFARLNVRLYSPLCLALALGTTLAVRG